MTTVIYGTQTTQYYINAVAAYGAGGAQLNIAGGSVVVGDGNGSTPLLSQLIAAAGCLDPIPGAGATIASVAIDGANSAQLDIGVVVPSTVNGVETGPFTVREFAIYDALGNLCVVGVTDLEKTTSGQGQIADLAFTASVVLSNASAVVVTPPSAGFATMAQVETAFNANLPTATAPLTTSNTTNPQGWTERVFGLRAATQPVDPVTTGEDAAASGYGRPASAAEFSSGTPFAGGYPFPWVTVQQGQQLRAAFPATATTIVEGIGRIALNEEAISGLTQINGGGQPQQVAFMTPEMTVVCIEHNSPAAPAPPNVVAPLTYASGSNAYGVSPATATAVGVAREAASAEAVAGVTNAGLPGPAFITPEGLAAAEAASAPLARFHAGVIYNGTAGAIIASIGVAAVGNGSGVIEVVMSSAAADTNYFVSALQRRDTGSPYTPCTFLEDAEVNPRTTTTFSLNAVDVVSQLNVASFGGVEIIVWR